MPALREAIGDKAFEELEGLIVEKVRLYAVGRDEFREVLSRLDIVEHDLSELKTEVKELRREMNERFARINERFDMMNDMVNLRFDRVNEKFDRINERFDKMNERFDQMYERMTTLVKWTVGTLALFGSIISILLAIEQFVR